MYSKLFLIFILPALLIKGNASITGNALIGSFFENQKLQVSVEIKRDTATWFDGSRNRPVPIAIYFCQSLSDSINRTYIKQKVVFINPGYPGKNTDYGYIARNLAEHGYYVVTIQHNLPSDPPIPTKGDLYKLRQPFWSIGVQNILFVLGKLKKVQPNLDYENLIIIGHSNGGDISMLLAKQYPKVASIIISLDNRRMPFPRSKYPKVFSIRSSDQPADPGVLPTVKDQTKYKTVLVNVNTVHDDMGGFGTKEQLSEINNHIIQFLQSNILNR